MTVLRVGAADSAAATINAARAAAGPFVALLIDPDCPEMERALLVATAAPLALERAPGVRIAVIDVARGATPADVAAALDYLAGAELTTGQVLRIA